MISLTLREKVVKGMGGARRKTTATYLD